VSADETPTAADPSGIAPLAKASWHEPRFLRAWAATELAIACALIVVIFLTVLWQVISRYVPRLNWPALSELANYSFIVLTFVMVGYLIGRNGHISIKIIDYVVKGRAFTAVKAVSAACTAVICGLLAWEAVGLIEAYPTRTTAALEIPLWMLYAVPLTGFSSGVVRAVINIFTASRPEVPFNAAEAK
jgi:TRAP-type C4-dicarboxylate transport system permease small subunit